MSNGVKSITRDSNFELLRIVSMFMIVLLHVGTHGIQRYIDVSNAFSNYNEFLYFFIRSLSIIAVNLYVLMSGYFLSKSTFKLHKLINLFFEVSFFSTVIYLINVFAGYIDFNSITFLKHLFAVFTGRYWFVTVYFVLYGLSPYLNILIDNMKKKDHFQLLVYSFLAFSLWQFFYPIDFIGVSRGFGLAYFVFLYILAAYIRNYDFVFRDFKIQVYLITYVIGALLISLIVYRYSNTVGDMHSYNSPIVLLMSYVLFMFFKKLKIASPKVNAASIHVFGIYLVHEQNSFREVLWGQFGIVEDIVESNPSLIILKMIGYAMVVFLCCWFVSFFIKTGYNFLVIIFNKLRTKLSINLSSNEIKESKLIKTIYYNESN